MPRSSAFHSWSRMTRACNYVAAWVDYDVDKVIVLERDDGGKVTRVKYNPPYYFFIQDDEGEYESIFGDKLIKAEFESREQYEQAKRHFPDKFESDIAPLKRVLMDNYYGVKTPTVHYAFLDIEVDYSQKIGFAGPTNPYAPINAVTIWQSWTGKFLTYVLAPPGWTGNKADLDNEITRLIKAGLLRDGQIPEIRICADEHELLGYMLVDITDADIISGWNSEFFDLPYIAERLLLAGGERMLSRLDWLGTRPPKKEMVNRFGTEEPIYRLTGRAHLDYMRLFQKFTFEGRTSYALGNILQEEVGVGKLDYEGTLEQLYNNDFPTFIAYNFRDVDGLVQLDQKFKFIALANQMAHESTVDFSAVLGTVSYVETAIANHAHYVLNKRVHDKNIQDHDKVEGAIVMSPVPGLYEWVGSVDINSLYPNTIRSLNISPEMIVGQFGFHPEGGEGEAAWRDIRAGNQNRHTLILESGEQHVATAQEWQQLLTEQKWALSAYGTVFDQGSGRGVVADILGYWYTERKRLQAEKKKWTKVLKDLAAGTPEYVEAKKQEEHFDLLQLTKKISMNSLYGALLNISFRFGDMRMGASVTASGRGITTHMAEMLGFLLTGKRHTLEKRYDPKELEKKRAKQAQKARSEFRQLSCEEWLALPTEPTFISDNFDDGDDDEEGSSALYRAIEWDENGNPEFSKAIIYGDTDSTYFRCLGAVDKASAVEIADFVAEQTNASFPEFMRTAFLCHDGFDGFIMAGREVVAARGLFQAKKKYMLKVVDLEGFAVDKMKSQGSEIKKADTPKIIQVFLKATVDMILNGQDYDRVATFVNGQRKVITKQKDNVFLLGVAKRVNNLDKFAAEYHSPGTVFTDSGRKLSVPGHVRASLNYNTLLDVFEPGAKTVRSGDKVLVFYLKPNDYKYDSIAFPSEFTRFPKWFTDNFAVDIKRTEEKMFDSKLRGIFEALNKDVPSPQSVLTNSILEF